MYDMEVMEEDDDMYIKLFSEGYDDCEDDDLQCQEEVDNYLNA